MVVDSFSISIVCIKGTGQASHVAGLKVIVPGSTIGCVETKPDLVDIDRFNRTNSTRGLPAGCELEKKQTNGV